jgi:hypothetical protein
MTPGRRVALLLGVPVVLVVIAGNGFSLVQNIGKGSFSVSDTVSLRDGGLTVNFNGGDATVRGGASSAGSARVYGTVNYDLARPAVRTGPDTFSLACPPIDVGNCSLSGTVDAPAGATLTVNAGGGDLSAYGLAGPDTLDSDGGTLTVTGDTGDLIATSGGGDLNASQVSGAHVSLTSDGGTVTGTTVTAPQVTVGSGGGDVTLTFTAVPRDVRVISDGGTVKIVVPYVPHGYIVNETPDGGTVTGIQSSRGATDVITVNSGGGDINITESPAS